MTIANIFSKFPLSSKVTGVLALTAVASCFMSQRVRSFTCGVFKDLTKALLSRSTRQSLVNRAIRILLPEKKQPPSPKEEQQKERELQLKTDIVSQLKTELTTLNQTFREKHNTLSQITTSARNSENILARDRAQYEKDIQDLKARQAALTSKLQEREAQKQNLDPQGQVERDAELAALNSEIANLEEEQKRLPTNLSLQRAALAIEESKKASHRVEANKSALLNLEEQAKLFFKNDKAFSSLDVNDQASLINLLKNFFSLCVQAAANSGASPAQMRSKMALTQTKRAKQEELLSMCVAKKLITEDQKATLLEKLTEAGQQLSQEEKKKSQLTLIAKYYPYLVPQSLKQEHIDYYYNLAYRIETQINNLERSFDKLIERAQLPPDSSSLYKIKVNFTGREDKPFEVTAEFAEKNPFLGYSLCVFLHEAQILTEDKKWNGEQKFVLTKEEFNKFNSHLKESDQLFEQATNVFRELLCEEDMSPYIKLAQKSKKEFLENMAKTAIATSEAISDCREKALEVGLLFGQIGLHIENHPEKVFIKGEIEKIYRLEEMKSFGDVFKTFVTGTYLTNLNTFQLRQILPRLRQLLVFQRYATDYSKEKSLCKSLGALVGTGILLGEAATFRGARSKYKNEKLLAKSIFMRPISLSWTNLITFTSTDQERLHQPFDSLISNLEENDLMKFKEAQDQSMKDLMLSHTVPYFKQLPESYKPSKEAITQLYGTEAKKDYGETRGVFRDLKRLFGSFKEAPVVKAKIDEMPELEQKIDGLREALEDRIMTKYPGLPETGWPSSKKLMRESIETLELYVASVVNQQESKATKESIEISLSQVIDLDIPALKAGCDEGLMGRILSLYIALSVDGNPSLEKHIVQVQKDCIEQASNAFRQDIYQAGNSSHIPVYVQEIYNFLTILKLPNEAQKTHADLSPNAKTIFFTFVQKYTAEKIYAESKSFLETTLRLLTSEENTEENDSKVYAMLKSIGFGTTDEKLDRKYRLNGNKENPWQYHFIEADLIQYLPNYLVEKKIIVVSKPSARGPTFQKEGGAIMSLEAPRYI